MVSITCMKNKGLSGVHDVEIGMLTHEELEFVMSLGQAGPDGFIQISIGTETLFEGSIYQLIARLKGLTALHSINHGCHSA